MLRSTPEDEIFHIFFVKNYQEWNQTNYENLFSREEKYTGTSEQNRTWVKKLFWLNNYVKGRQKSIASSFSIACDGVSWKSQSFPRNKYSKLLGAMFASAEKLLIQKSLLVLLETPKFASRSLLKVQLVEPKDCSQLMSLRGMSRSTRAQMSTMTLHWTREPRKANEKS